MIQLNFQVLHLSGKSTFKVSVPDGTTVQELKVIIYETKGISTDLQCLIFKGKILKEDKKLSEYDVRGDIMLLHREPPFQLPEEYLEMKLMSDVILYILGCNRLPRGINIEENIASLEHPYYKIYDTLFHIKRILQQLGRVADGIVPNQLEYLDLEFLQVNFNRMMLLFRNENDQYAELTFFLVELNDLCDFFSPFLQFYGNLLINGDSPSPDKARTKRVERIKNLVNDLTHYFAYAYRMLNEIRYEIETRGRTFPYEPVTNYHKEIQTLDPTTHPDSTLFMPEILSNELDQLSHPIDRKRTRPPTPMPKKQDENEGQIDCDSSKEDKASDQPECNGSSSPTSNTESKEDEKSC